MAERNWTTEQQQCLTATGTVLVSAAAGSGKTAVLVERVIRLVTDPVCPVDVDELLVVTFTKAAAAEMKQRLAQALAEQLAARPSDHRLQRQLMRLPGASISTVHSFCGNLIREHFHRLPEVSPQFRVAEEGQTAPLRTEAMNEVLEEFYKAGDPAFLQLVDLLGGARDDAKLAARVERLYDFVQAAPYPERWLQQQAALYHEQLPAADTPFGQEITLGIEDTLNWCDQLYDKALRLVEQDEGLAAYRPLLLEERGMVQQWLATFAHIDWDERLRRLQGAAFSRLPVAKKADPTQKERVQALRNQAKRKLQALPELLGADEATIAADTAALAPAIDVLFDLVRRFAARFSEKKQAHDLLDFNDLEHLSLALLTEPCDDGSWHRTPLAQEIAARYACVMVDEYQDTNPTQEQLFRAVSREEGNLFFVGDVKQSIYAFRNATPDLFIARRDRYPAFDGTAYPAVIRLGHNFRSRRSVTETVNFLCRQLMSRETCGVDYRSGEELVPAATYPVQEGDTAELLLVEKSALSHTDTAEAAEARGIAARIAELLQTMTVTDKAGERPLRCGDICILLRSVKGRAAAYADELNRCGIPAVSGAGNGFFDAPEIALTLSLLRFLDNPLQDVALLAVLLSPIFAFTPDDLAQLRTDDRRCPLFVSLRRQTRAATPLGERCRLFLQRTDRLRTLAAATPADRLLTRLFEELSLPAVMGARTHGEQRTANLRQLLTMARRFEQNGYRGLSAFVRFLERQAARGDAAPAAVAGGQDAVRVLTIHASKGLEFPVVFLAGLGKRFNAESERDALLLHRELGAGMNVFNADTLETHDTLQRRALISRIRRDARAEALRVLYVALTRARERLCLVLTDNIAAAATRAAAAIGEEAILPAGAVTEATSVSDWLMMALLRHPDAGELRTLVGLDGLLPLPCDARLTIRHLANSAPPLTTAQCDPPRPAPDAVYQAELAQRLVYQYPYAALGAVPVKAAASELAHAPLRERYVAVSRPAFFSESELSPAERGTALHQFMQFADYEAAAADTPAEIRRLVRDGFLTAQQAHSLPLPRLRGFFESELYARIRRSPVVRREYAFTVERPAALCAPALPPEIAAGEQVLIQGIADCVFEEDGSLVIVDYKTDRVASAEELAERYRPQLALYAEALTAGLKLPVAQRLLYSFALQRVVAV